MNVITSSRFALLAAALCVAGPQLGCRTSCDNTDEGPAQRIDQDANPSPDVYESAPWNADYLEFKPQKRYRFYHGLDGAPALFKAWVGFEQNPLITQHSISEAVGNMAIWECVNERFVQVRNDTCEVFYLRFTAADPTPITDTAADGGEANASARSGVCADDQER